jgi:site-specific DNA-methyltransferase (adenine-specific)
LSLTSAATVAAFWPAARTLDLLIAANATHRVKHRCLYMRKRDPKPMVGNRTRWSVEPIWILTPDGVVLMGGDDVFDASTPRLGRDHDATGHPYQKPLMVMSWLITKLPTGVLCDPFMGSGTTLVAAQLLGRSAIGVDDDERWCEIAARRLSQGVLPLAL